MADALTNLTIGFTETTTDAEFLAQLTSGTGWGIVIIDNYDTTLSAATNQAIRSYIAGGGIIWAASNNWEYATALALGALLGPTYSEPKEIYPWATSHPLFTGRHDVPDLIPTFGTCGSATEGYELTALTGSLAVAGYYSGDDAVVIANGGRTVLFGGVPGMFAGNFDFDGTVDGLEMAENAIDYLTDGPIFIDGFDSGGLSNWN